METSPSPSDPDLGEREASHPSGESSAQAPGPARFPSMESLHSYLQSEKEHPFASRRGTSSFVLVHNKLSWRPSPAIMTILVDFFPNSTTPWAYGVSTPGARLYTEHCKQGLKLDGYAVQARTTYQWFSSEGDEDKRAFRGCSGAVAEEDQVVESYSRQNDWGGGGAVDTIPVYPVDDTVEGAAAQRGYRATTHVYPTVGFSTENSWQSKCISRCHEAARRSAPGANTGSSGLYECINMMPELSLCVSVKCTSRDTLQQALLGSWWLSRYFGVSLTLEGAKQEGLAVFKELQERLFIKELRLIYGVFSESWLQAISTCSELISLTAQECTAESADIQLQYVNPILSRQSAETRHSPLPAPVNPPAAASNWYISGSRSLGLLLKLKCLHIIQSPVTEGFVDNLVSSPALECCVFYRVRGLKSLQALSSLRALRSLVVSCSTISTEGVAPIRECSRLTSLTMENCQFVDDLDFLTGLKGTLERLSLSHNWLTDSHLQSILSCTRLRELHLRSQKNVTDVSALRQLDRLEVLDVSENLIVTDGVLPLTNRSTLRRLAMESLRCMRTWRRVFEPVTHAVSLVSLTLSGNDQVEDVEFGSLHVCWQLRVLDLSECTRLVTLDFLTHMTHSLRWLNLAGTAVTDSTLAVVGECRALRLLNLSDCRGVTRTPFTSVAPAMELLYLARTVVTDVALQALCVFCPKLRLLDLQQCLLLRRLGGLSRLRYLRELDLAYTKIRDNALCQLHACRSLELLNVSHCTRLTSLLDLSRVRSLKWVRADNLGAAGLASPINLSPPTPALRPNVAANTPAISPTTTAAAAEADGGGGGDGALEVSSLSASVLHGRLSMVLELSLRRGAWTDASLSLMLTSASSLVTLNISECSELRQLTGLEQLAPSLVHLRARHTHISNAALVAVSACVHLEMVDLAECTELTSLNPLGALTQLLELDASDTQITNTGLVGLATCAKLRVLNLSKCRYLSDVNVLGQLTRLVQLNMDNTNVTYEGTRQLVRCVSLKRASFTRCPTLLNTALLGSGAPKQLEVLEVYGTLIPTRGVGQRQLHACRVM